MLNYKYIYNQAWDGIGPKKQPENHIFGKKSFIRVKKNLETEFRLKP